MKNVGEPKIADQVSAERRLRIESLARAHAECGRYEAPHLEVDGTYQRRLMMGAENAVYAQTHAKRVARLERMK